ncbi:cell cycle control protein cwf19 [Coccidioides immitis H538.4]|uniref:Cell cycle control protein cwf19 n=1 Tax=Coccidioides immitis H538.4 TaxID=396776 RepID=A0A0J8RSM4_COCIT|nr:cell cycle control protein cwf19 [Coccidioides immitis H538.4]
MTLEDFERELAESQQEREKRERRREKHGERNRDRDRDRDRERRSYRGKNEHKDRERERDRDNNGDRSRHHSDRPHHHHSSRHRSNHSDSEHAHKHKRSRHHSSSNADDGERSRKRRLRHDSRDERDEERSKEHRDPGLVLQEEPSKLQRDAWMEAPSALEVDYVQRRQQKPPSPRAKMLQADFEYKLHEKELNRHLHDLQEDDPERAAVEQPAEHEVDYTFGDSGSHWRMTKLKAVYRQAEEEGRKLEEVAIERYGDLRSFDDAREEEIELGRRDRLGNGYVGKIKPNGDLYQERKLEMGVRRDEGATMQGEEIETTLHEERMETNPPSQSTKPLDSTALNRLKAQMMKAKLRGSSNAADLEAQYNAAVAAAANRKESDVVVLGVMENRMLAGHRAEVKAVESKRGRERGLVQENEDMSIEDMVREERRTRGQAGGEGMRFAERIAKDAKFDILPLCYREDTETPPIAPVVSLATRVYLTLPTEPELSEGAACIVPIQHRTNLLECDDDEWEEIRNFMKCLTRMYHDQGRGVIFYENAARPQQRRHATMEAVPLPYSLGETASAFFKEAILSADEEWTQHKKVIDTLAKSRQGLGKLAFRRTLAKEMPYFHVWFELDGGLGHIVEDSNRWPRGDLFAREIIGGMLDLEPDVIKRQGRWQKGGDRRVEGFKKRWNNVRLDESFGCGMIGIPRKFEPRWIFRDCCASGAT